MKNYFEDFKDRVEEVEKYFSLVVTLNEVNTYNNSINLPNGKNYIIDSHLQRILKSSCYLILYNLIESSVRNGIIAIYDAIHDEGLTYTDLNDKIRTIWIENQSDRLTKTSTTKKSVTKNVQRILNSVVNDSVIFFEEDKLPISGNLNAERIEVLIKQYGFFGKIEVDNNRVEYILDHIVKMRCDLAHGNVSFRWAGSGIVTSEIVNIKNDTIIYLDNLLQNISEYINQKKYKKTL